MLDLYESVRSNSSFNKLEVGGLLFAEYTCPIGVEKLGLWAHTDYLVHVISGKKTWHTTDGVWTAKAGETLFFKKGAAIVEQFFEVDFCLLMFFIPDQLIRETVKELAETPGHIADKRVPMKSAAKVQNDTGLNAFIQSVLAYFSGRKKPSEPLLRIKLKELVVSLLTSGENPEIAAYLRRVADDAAPSITEVMEANFRFNLSLQEYAKLCHRSLSTFKRDFHKQFEETPGKWLLRKRVDHAAGLLRSTDLRVTEIVFESGFEDVSHFSRVFKQRYDVSPSGYRSRRAPRG